MQVIKNDLCTGCGTCIAACPTNSIKLVLNKEKGIYVPELNVEKCIECNTCYAVCPGHEVDFHALNQAIFGRIPEDHFIGNYIEIYLGHSTDQEIRYSSSSGGLITQILIFALEKGLINGALVTRMKKDNPLEPEPFIARTKQEIIDAAKSKYCPVPANIALKEIMNASQKEKFAVVGLPCHIHGIRKLEQLYPAIKTKIVLHIGIVCNHTPNFLATKFLINKNKVKCNEISNIDYRGSGWPGGMQIVTKREDRIYIPHFSSNYWGIVFNSFFFPSRCMLCSDKICELSDASFADAWIPELTKNDNIGTSLIISRNNNFEDILSKAALEKLIVERSDKNIPYRSQGIISVKKRAKANLVILRDIFGKVVPHYNQTFPKIEKIYYINSMISFILNFASSQHYLWWIIDLYVFLIEIASQFKSWLLRKD